MDFLQVLRENEKEIKKRFGVAKIGIFGSTARGEANRDSDIDILVEFEEGKKTFDNFMDLAFFLEGIFGRKVDLLTPLGLHPYLRPYVEREVVWSEE